MGLLETLMPLRIAVLAALLAACGADAPTAISEAPPMVLTASADTVAARDTLVLRLAVRDPMDERDRVDWISAHPALLPIYYEISPVEARIDFVAVRQWPEAPVCVRLRGRVECVLIAVRD
jgi:hypothetical protein